MDIDVLRIVLDNSPHVTGVVPGSTTLRELGCDSVDLLMIMSEVEDEILNRELTAEELDQFNGGTTIEEIEKFCESARVAE